MSAVSIDYKTLPIQQAFSLNQHPPYRLMAGKILVHQCYAIVPPSRLDEGLLA